MLFTMRLRFQQSTDARGGELAFPSAIRTDRPQEPSPTSRDPAAPPDRSWGNTDSGTPREAFFGTMLAPAFLCLPRLKIFNGEVTDLVTAGLSRGMPEAEVSGWWRAGRG
jgi:hypothetical protein